MSAAGTTSEPVRDEGEGVGPEAAARTQNGVNIASASKELVQGGCRQSVKAHPVVG